MANNPPGNQLSVKVKCRSEKMEGLMDRISKVIHRGPQHLDVESSFECRREPDTQIYPYLDFMPLNLYTNKNIGFLEAHVFGLKSMSLVEVRFRDDVSLEKLVSGCPVLEELTLIRDMNSSFVGEVDRFMRDLSAKKNIAEFFLSGISSVRHMTISEDTVVALKHYSDAGLLPKFNNLSRLEAVFPCMLLPFLPVFLKRCLNLKHLILKVVDANWAKDEFELTGVPGCFLSTLECIQLKSIHYWKEEAIKIATYFLQNAAVLKKLTLSFMDYPRLVPDKKIFEEINKVTKLSPTCQILHEWEPGF
ncbi:unnamed protein product [Eruca vesicaria subsp. sativa]|uniref:FBD domain-containing protein n=1 Tax=Eruca vesicaria subsp. sativa TaxID=29727 RepID=A0ABC8INP0_ERUVS|nr:unnamed protein product [Eruca vesicaria subsp. sativa]